MSSRSYAETNMFGCCAFENVKLSPAAENSNSHQIPANVSETLETMGPMINESSGISGTPTRDRKDLTR